jgi:NitT/TauT family transport system ATP-binding protein
VIVFENVSKTFDELVVLRDLDLHIREGEILGIVGPSGVGKSTVLTLITGIIAPDEGRVRVIGGPLAYVFQEPRLLPWRTARDNVAVALRARGMDKAAAIERADQWLQRVGLKGFEDYHPAELSGGMAQRVSIARAFAIEPRILLLDEPFSNMDAPLRSSLMSVLKEMIQERQPTVVLVTHELTEALQLAHRIVELSPDHRVRELDLTDRRSVAAEWLSGVVGKLEK